MGLKVGGALSPCSFALSKTPVDCKTALFVLSIFKLYLHGTHSDHEIKRYVIKIFVFCFKNVFKKN
jgi:hypothetical protein